MARTKAIPADNVLASAGPSAEAPAVAQAAAEKPAQPTLIDQPLTFADVMRINRQLREAGLVPEDPSLPPKKRAKLKRF